MTTREEAVVGRDVAAWLDRLDNDLTRAAAVLCALDEQRGYGEALGRDAAMCVREASQAVARLSPGAGVGEVLDVAAAAAVAAARGSGGVLISHLLARAAQAHPANELTPVGMARLLRSLAEDLPLMLIAGSRLLDDIVESLRSDLATTGSIVWLAEIETAAWIAIHTAMSEAWPAEPFYPLGALLSVVAASLADVRSDSGSALETTIEFLADGARVDPPPHGLLTLEARCEASPDEIERWREDCQASGLVTGVVDDFGIGSYVLVVRAAHPLDHVPAILTRAIVSTPQPLRLSEPDEGVVSMLERRSHAGPVTPAVLAVTGGRGVVDDIAQLGGVVVWDRAGGPVPLGDLLARLVGPVVLAAPSLTATDAAALRQVDPDGLIIAPVSNDLDVLHVASAALEPVSASLSTSELAALQRSRIRNELETLDSFALTDEELGSRIEAGRTIEVLLSARERETDIFPLLQGRDAWQRIDIIRGGQPGATIVGVVS